MAEYHLAQQSWKAEGALVVSDESGQQLLVVPIQFLRLGRVQKYSYVQQQVEATWREPGHLVRADGTAALADDTAIAGKLTFRRADGHTGRCTPRVGPRFKYKHRAPVEGQERSTMSNSKRSSTNQSNFRVRLQVRDGFCLVTEAEDERCTAAHILPVSRKEYYSEVLGYETPNLYHVQFGILLRDDIHHIHDRGDLALYPLSDSEVIVHVFKPDTDSRQYHGKVISFPTRMRGNPDNWPDRDLLQFHYRQCVMMRMRGFASGMSPPGPGDSLKHESKS